MKLKKSKKWAYGSLGFAIVIIATIAYAAAGDRYIYNQNQDKDLYLCVNDGGVDTCPMSIIGTTGKVSGVGAVNYEVTQQSVGSVGAVNNTQQAVSLTDISAADSTVAGFSLSGGVTKTFGTATATLTNNAVAAFDSEGFYGRGDVARFDGSSNAISSTDAHFLSTGKDWSFSMWVAADAWEPSGGQLLMGNGGGTNGTRGTDILLNGPGSAGIQLRVSDNGGASASDQLSVDGSSFKSGSWHHIAGTYDFSATTLKFYIDGVLVDSSSSVTDTNTESTFYLGDENASGAAFNGSIQDFIWIDGDLYSDAEVNAIYSRRFEGQQIKAGHVLTSESFSSGIASTKLSFWNLNDVNDDSTNSRALTDEGGMAFTGPDILGGSTAAVFDGTAAGTLAYTADDFFNKGRADFTMGVWVSLNDWDKSGTDEVLFGTSPSSGDRVLELIMKTNDFTLRPVITTLTTTDTIDFVPNPEPINGSWHHIVLVYDSTPNEMRLYWDGYFGASVTLGDDLKVGGSNEFNLGTFRNQESTFYNGKMQEFFWTQTLLPDDEIRKLYAAKITHNQAMAIGDQDWDGTFLKGDNATLSNLLGKDFILDMKPNSAFIDLGLDSSDQVILKLKND